MNPVRELKKLAADLQGTIALTKTSAHWSESIEVESQMYGAHGAATSGRVHGLPQEILDLAEKANEDYDTYGVEFEKVWDIIKKKMPKEHADNLDEASFWVEDGTLEFDTGN